MDIEKAIEIQKSFVTEYKCEEKEESEDIREFMIVALEELQQYRQIGTVDKCRMTMDELIELQEYLKLGTVNECWEAREKHTPKEPIIKTINGIMCTACPKCFCFSIPESKYCSNCGQALKWGD